MAQGLWNQITVFLQITVGRSSHFRDALHWDPADDLQAWEGIKDFSVGCGWNQAVFPTFIDGFLGALDWLNGAVDCRQEIGGHGGGVLSLGMCSPRPCLSSERMPSQRERMLPRLQPRTTAP